VLEEVFRDQWGRVLATLVGLLGDIELAEDAAQEAFALAAERWPRSGHPINPTGWLITAARNRAIDCIRRERTLAARQSSWRGSFATDRRNRWTKVCHSPMSAWS
jgi:RNA polymerase sigma-70 factor (ECF subfamily)